MVCVEDIGDEFNLSSIFLHHLNELDEDDEYVEELFANFSGHDEVISFVVALKQEGNFLFKLNDFSNAYVKYEKAIKSLCVVMPVVFDDINTCDENSLFRELAISLHVNLAASALKLNKLNIAMLIFF